MLIYVVLICMLILLIYFTSNTSTSNSTIINNNKISERATNRYEKRGVIVGHAITSEMLTEYKKINAKPRKNISDNYALTKMSLFNIQDDNLAKIHLNNTMRDITNLHTNVRELTNTTREDIFNITTNLHNWIAPPNHNIVVVPTTVVPTTVVPTTVVPTTVGQNVVGPAVFGAAAIKNKNKIENLNKTKKRVNNDVLKEAKINNDPQNVHDSALNKEQVKKFSKLVKLNKDNGDNNNRDITDLAEEILQYKAHNHFSDRSIPDRAMTIYVQVTQDSKYITSLNVGDGTVLCQIWYRINSKDNTENYNNLLEALIVNMAECIENSHPICTSGRVARILSTLTLLDTDTDLNTPIKTTDILRKEILSKAYVFLRSELDKVPEIRDKYDTGTADTIDADTNISNYITEIYNKFCDTVKNEYTNIDSKILEVILTEVKSGF